MSLQGVIITIVEPFVVLETQCTFVDSPFLRRDIIIIGSAYGTDLRLIN